LCCSRFRAGHLRFRQTNIGYWEGKREAGEGKGKRAKHSEKRQVIKKGRGEERHEGEEGIPNFGNHEGKFPPSGNTRDG
jgi:hypothetical protein